MRRTTLSVLIVLLCCLGTASARWTFTSYKRIREHELAYTCANNARAIVGEGDHVYIACTRVVSNVKQVYCVTSTDDGDDWPDANVVRVSDNVCDYAQGATIALIGSSGGGLEMAFEEYSSNECHVYCATSIDYGAHWSTPRRIANVDPDVQTERPSVATDWSTGNMGTLPIFPLDRMRT